MIADEVLPGRDETIAEGRVWLAFLGRAALDAALAEPLRDRYVRSHEAIAGGIALAQALGQAGPGLDPEREAIALVALADGLTAQILVGIVSHERAAEILRAHVDRIVKQP